MVVVVMLVCSLVYNWLQRPKSAPVQQAAVPVQSAPVQSARPPVALPAAPTETAPAAGASSDPNAAAPVTPAPSPAAANPTESKPAEAKPAESRPAQNTAAAPDPNAAVHVEIKADETVWVLARVDGKYAFSGTLEAGQSRKVDGVKDVVLRVGNAGSVAITVNGKPVGAVGPKGQPRTVQLTSGGFQIVPAKPPAVLLDPLDRF
jgi:cytoskeleton protein RodZ